MVDQQAFEGINERLDGNRLWPQAIAGFEHSLIEREVLVMRRDLFGKCRALRPQKQIEWRTVGEILARIFRVVITWIEKVRRLVFQNPVVRRHQLRQEQSTDISASTRAVAQFIVVGATEGI